MDWSASVFKNILALFKCKINLEYKYGYLIDNLYLFYFIIWNGLMIIKNEKTEVGVWKH